jgi:hypothetical protein
MASMGVGVAVLFAVRLSGLAQLSRWLDPTLVAIAASGLAFGGVLLLRHGWGRSS